jgi:hypothetical protein
MLTLYLKNPNLVLLYTDASTLIGFGAVCGTRWLAGKWPSAWAAHPIIKLEMAAIVIAVATFAYSFTNKVVCVYTDNLAPVTAINKVTSPNRPLMHLIRKLVSLLLKRNISFTARHIEGMRNGQADSLSRGKVDDVQEVSPSADETFPSTIPWEWHSLNWKTPAMT